MRIFTSVRPWTPLYNKQIQEKLYVITIITVTVNTKLIISTVTIMSNLSYCVVMAYSRLVLEKNLITHDVQLLPNN